MGVGESLGSSLRVYALCAATTRVSFSIGAWGLGGGGFFMIQLPKLENAGWRVYARFHSEYYNEKLVQVRPKRQHPDLLVYEKSQNRRGQEAQPERHPPAEEDPRALASQHLRHGPEGGPMAVEADAGSRKVDCDVC